MELEEVLVEVWRQMLVEERPEVVLGDQRRPVHRTRNLGLRVVTVSVAGVSIDAIEQNPRTRSAWAKRAAAGARVVQFSRQGQYIGNVCDGRLTRYASWPADSGGTKADPTGPG